MSNARATSPDVIHPFGCLPKSGRPRAFEANFAYDLRITAQKPSVQSIFEARSMRDILRRFQRATFAIYGFHPFFENVDYLRLVTP